MADISNRALINALIALSSEVVRTEQFLADTESEDELQDAGESLLELQAAFGEFVAIYKDRQQNDAGLPSLSDLLPNTPL